MNTDLEFVKSKLDHWVPIVNGILMHSSIDPQKEAAQFVDQEWDKIAEVKSLIVFGLGGGFHVEALMKRKTFNIVVIEPQKEMVKVLAEKKLPILEQIEVLAGAAPAQVAREPSVIRAMSQSYALVKHPASLRVSSFYFTAVLQTLNERTINRLRLLASENRRLIQFLDSLDISGEQILTLPMVEEAMVRRGQGLDREGLIWMAMRELIV